MSSNWGRFLLLFGVSVACCLAQSTALGQVAQAAATETVAIARWVGIILLVGCGLGLMAGGSYMAGKVAGAIIGLVLALGSPSIVAWVQAHGAF